MRQRNSTRKGGGKSDAGEPARALAAPQSQRATGAMLDARERGRWGPDPQGLLLQSYGLALGAAGAPEGLRQEEGGRGISWLSCGGAQTWASAAKLDSRTASEVGWAGLHSQWDLKGVSGGGGVILWAKEQWCLGERRMAVGSLGATETSRADVGPEKQSLESATAECVGAVGGLGCCPGAVPRALGEHTAGDTHRRVTHGMRKTARELKASRPSDTVRTCVGVRMSPGLSSHPTTALSC